MVGKPVAFAITHSLSVFPEEFRKHLYDADELEELPDDFVLISVFPDARNYIYRLITPENREYARNTLMKLAEEGKIVLIL